VPVERATRLLDALAGDLATWRSACGDPPDGAPVIPNRRGEPWADYDWDNLARSHLPSSRRSGWPPRRRRGRPQEGPPTRSAIQLRNAAHLRRPAAPVRRQAARPQRRDVATGLCAGVGGLRPGPAHGCRGADQACPLPVGVVACN
jgi:hypothetical protein